MSNPAPDPDPSSNHTTATPAPGTNADIERWNKLFYNTSLGIVIAAPIIVALPPRKLDLHTFGLSVAWFLSAGVLVEHHTGKGLLWHIGSRIPSEGNARRREREARAEAEAKGLKWQGVDEAEGKKERGFLKRIWMGGEKDDWVEERMRKEKEAFEEGKGYADLIIEQVKEAFGSKGKGGGGDGKNDKKE